MFRFFKLRKWLLWSWLGSLIILSSLWVQVKIDVKINEWFGVFYDMIQKALAKPNAITIEEYWASLLSFISLGDKQILYNHFLTRFLMVIFFVSLISVSSILVIQHKKPAAVSKLKEAIVKDSDLDIIVSIPLINYYLKTHNVDAHYISIENPDELKYLDNINLSNVLVIGEYPTIFPNNYRINMGTIFFHNPYVNRMWSSIKTFRLEKK